MHRNLVMLAVVSLVAASAFAQTTVRCESTDGRYRECAVDGIGRIALTQQLSDAKCVEGKSWGYREGVVWVTSGCRADFALTDIGFQTRSGGRIVQCESRDGHRQVCETKTRGGVFVAQQLSDMSCVQGQTWGYDRNSIWVDEGCRARFVVGAGDRDPRRLNRSLDTLVTCESLDGRPSRCNADTSRGVQVVRQISDSGCAFGRDWGYDENGIWVDHGCRAEFAVRAPQQARAVITTTTPVVVTQPVVVMPAPQPVAAIPTVVCSSENNTRSHCRADTRNGMTLVRQLSDNPCVRDRSWGVDRDGVWVTDGCRGEFAFGHEAPAVPMMSAAPLPITVVCESIDGRRNHCAASTAMGVRLLRQMSDSDCLLNSTWGYDQSGVWVSGGCRAEFAIGEGYRADTSGPQAARVLCESPDGKRKVCAADTRMGVAVVRQISDAPCVLNSTWGFNSDGIWVTAGCRAEFVLRQ